MNEIDLMKQKDKNWMELSEWSEFAELKTYNQPPATINEIDEWMASKQFNFIHQFHSTKKKSKLSFFISFHWFTCELIGMKLKKYYNSNSSES